MTPELNRKGTKQKYILIKNSLPIGVKRNTLRRLEYTETIPLQISFYFIPCRMDEFDEGIRK